MTLCGRKASRVFVARRGLTSVRVRRLITGFGPGARLAFEHDGNAIAYWKGELVGFANQQAGFAIVSYGALAERADQKFKQACVHDEALNLKRGCRQAGQLKRLNALSLL